VSTRTYGANLFFPSEFDSSSRLIAAGSSASSDDGAQPKGVTDFYVDDRRSGQMVTDGVIENRNMAQPSRVGGDRRQATVVFLR